MHWWRLAVGILLVAGRAFCPLVGGQVPDAKTENGTDPELARVSWHLDLANYPEPRIPLPMVELFANRDEIYGNIPDAEFWYALRPARSHHEVGITALTMDRASEWRFELKDPSLRGTRPVLRKCFDEPVFSRWMRDAGEHIEI